MRFAVAALALLLSISPALAANWDVDRAKSKLGFSVNWGGQPFTGTFTRWKARIAFDRSRLDQAKVDVSIDLSSLTSGDADTDDSVKGAYGFEVAKYPIARFLATKFMRKDDGSYVADGTLTIKGVSKPVSLPFSLVNKGDRVHVVGRTAISRVDFNIGTGEWAKPTPVSYQVTVNVDLTATWGAR